LSLSLSDRGIPARDTGRQVGISSRIKHTAFVVGANDSHSMLDIAASSALCNVEGLKRTRRTRKEMHCWGSGTNWNTGDLKIMMPCDWCAPKV
jgi:hypothetical protein